MEVDTHDFLKRRDRDVAEGRRTNEADIVNDAVDPGFPDDCREPVAGRRIGKIERMELAWETLGRMARDTNNGVSVIREAL